MYNQPEKFTFLDAFIFYHPEIDESNRQVYCNDEACRVLSMNALPPSNDRAPAPDFPCLCVQWKQMLDQRVGTAIDAGGGVPGTGFIGLYQSWRRRYVIRGSILSDWPPTAEKRDTRYLFRLERLSDTMPQLNAIFRKWSLGRREQEIARLLLKDKTNKEIAETLDLSVNTVKTYLKLLMRKLGVVSRAGVISRIFMENIS